MPVGLTVKGFPLKGQVFKGFAVAAANHGVGKAFEPFPNLIGGALQPDRQAVCF